MHFALIIPSILALAGLLILSCFFSEFILSKMKKILLQVRSTSQKEPCFFALGKLILWQNRKYTVVLVLLFFSLVICFEFTLLFIEHPLMSFTRDVMLRRKKSRKTVRMMTRWNVASWFLFLLRMNSFELPSRKERHAFFSLNGFMCIENGFDAGQVPVCKRWQNGVLV